MKLELKHLAAYLPYRINPLQLQYEGGIHTLDGLSGAWNVDLRQAMRVIENVHVETVKPLLIPLTELRNDQTVISELIAMASGSNTIGGLTPVEGLNDTAVLFECTRYENPLLFYYSNNSFHLYINNEGVRLNIVNQLELYGKLFQHHFDVFNLIESGLALNKLDYK